MDPRPRGGYEPPTGGEGDRGRSRDDDGDRGRMAHVPLPCFFFGWVGFVGFFLGFFFFCLVFKFCWLLFLFVPPGGSDPPTGGEGGTGKAPGGEGG